MISAQCASSFFEQNLTIEKVSILLAMTASREQEEELKRHFTQEGYLCGVTEIAGVNDELRRRLLNAVVGASLNLGIVQRNSNEIHTLVHATLEAAQGLALNIPVVESFRLKAAISRKDGWICVAFFGVRAMHSLTNQQTVSMGVMHI